jgi:ligand-binding sensor domain-containing protein
MKRLIISCLLTLTVSVCTADWVHTNGPTGGCVQAFASSGPYLFAGTYGGGVFVSGNNGDSWYVANTGLTSFDVKCFGVIGTNLFAGTSDGGVFLSTNNGTTWTAVNMDLSNLNVNAFAVSGSTVFAGTQGGVFRSTNNGVNWTAVNNGLTGLYVTALAFMGNNLFAGTRGGTFRSSNNGESWTIVITPPSGGGVTAFAVVGSSFFAGVDAFWDSYIWRSTDNGITWTNMFQTPLMKCFAVSGTNLYAGTCGGVFRTSDNGTSWSLVNSGVTDSSVCGLVSVGSDVFIGTRADGVFRSTDQGEHWVAATTGLSNVWVTSFATRGSKLFAGAAINLTYYGPMEICHENAGVFRSTDSGTNWIGVNAGLVQFPADEYCMASSGSFVFAGAMDRECSGELPRDGRGVFRSSDDGASWTATTFGNFNIGAIAVNGADLIAGTAWPSNTGLIKRSTDSGASWTLINTGIASEAVSALAVSPNGTGGTIFYAGTYDGVFRSTNNGGMWASVNSGLPTRREVQCLAASAGGLFAAIDTSGIFRTTNNGESWTAVNTGLTSRKVHAFAVSGNHIFAATDGGIFLTANDGTIWTPVNTGLAFPLVQSLIVNDGDLYAGTYGNGVWRRPLSEMITDVEIKQQLPIQFALEQNYPNPFNPTTRIKYQLPTQSHVTLKVYNLLGQEVATLANEVRQPGMYTVQFDGSGLANGVYFYGLVAGEFQSIKKMIVLK